MKTIWRIYKKEKTNKGNDRFVCLNNHYVNVISFGNKKKVIDNINVYEMPVCSYNTTYADEKNIEIPVFKTQDEAIDFMIKYRIEGFAMLTVE